MSLMPKWLTKISTSLPLWKKHAGQGQVQIPSLSTHLLHVPNSIPNTTTSEITTLSNNLRHPFSWCTLVKIIYPTLKCTKNVSLHGKDAESRRDQITQGANKTTTPPHPPPPPPKKKKKKTHMGSLWSLSVSIFLGFIPSITDVYFISRKTLITVNVSVSFF